MFERYVRENHPREQFSQDLRDLEGDVKHGAQDGGAQTQDRQKEAF